MMRVVLFLIDTYIETVRPCSISSINLDVSCLCRIYFREIYKDISLHKDMGPSQELLALRARPSRWAACG